MSAPAFPPPGTADATVAERLVDPRAGRLFLLPRPGIPLLHLALASPVGSADDPPGLEGLAVVCAALLKAGAGARSPAGLAEALERRGIDLVSRVTWRRTRLAVELLAEDAELGFDILEDTLLRPRFEAGAVSGFLARWVRRLEARAWRAEDAARDALARLRFGEHRYGAPLLGTPASARRLDRTAVETFYATCLRPAWRDLVAAGAFDPAAAERRAAPFLAGGGALPPAPPAPSGAGGRFAWVHRPRAEQAHVRLALPLPDPGEPAAVARRWLGRLLTERLAGRLRGELGLTYGVRGEAEERPGASSYEIHTAVPVDAVATVLREAVAGVERLREEPAAFGEIGLLARRARGERLRALETLDGLAGSVLDEGSGEGPPPPSPDDLRKAAAGLRREQLAATVAAPVPFHRCSPDHLPAPFATEEPVCTVC